MARIKIITDSASDIPQKYIDKYDISYLPICIVMDGKIYRDRYDLDGREYSKSLRTMEQIPTTSMVSMATIEEEFRKNLDNYDHQVFVTMSAKGSGGHNAALLVKSQLEEELGKEPNITIIDSNLYSIMYGKAVVEMAKKAAEGAELEEVIKTYEENTANACAFFLVDDLKFLEKGGRIKPGVAFVGGLLGIKPILTIADGLVECIGKERGKVKSLEKIVSLSVGKYDGKSKIWIASGDADEACAEAISMLKERLDNPEIETYDLGCVISTHAGSGVVGVIFDKGE